MGVFSNYVSPTNNVLFAFVCWGGPQQTGRRTGLPTHLVARAAGFEHVTEGAVVVPALKDHIHGLEQQVQVVVVGQRWGARAGIERRLVCVRGCGLR